jgi:membrane fusion protein (multidrug efflux system)
MRPRNSLYAILRNSMAVVALLVGLLPAGCDRQQQPAPPPVPEVGVVTVRPHTVVLTAELPGRTSAFRVAEIRPQVSGLIQKRLFTEGSDVRAGQVLYLIDPAPFQATLDNAKAALGRAEANLSAMRSRASRFEELLAVKAVSQQDYDDAAAALKQTEADIAYWNAMVKTARINLQYTRITAPISGRIGRSGVTEGALVSAYQPVPLATIQQLDPLYVDVPQSTAELLRLQRRIETGSLHQNGSGQKKVILILEDGTAYPSEGALQFRDVTVDQTTGTVTLRIVFPNPEGVLLPGMFVRAVVREGTNEAAILVPQEAVSRDPKGNPVTLVVDSQGKVEERQIELDRAIGNRWLVRSGLTPGERVIVEGIQKVRPGSLVKAVSSDEADVKRPEAGATDRPVTPSN